MTIKKTRIIKYELENPSFKGVEFGELSTSFLPMDCAVPFTAKQGRILWSAREAGAFSIEDYYNGFRYNGCPMYSTRTVDIGIKIDGKFYHAIDDTINPEQNLVIARAEECAESHFLNGKYLLPVTDPLVKDALSRAEKTGRIVEATESLLELKTKTVNGKSEFGQNDLIKAIFLDDVAESYAQMLNRLRGYNHGHILFLASKSLERIGVDGNFVEVRCVHLNPFTEINIFPDGRFYADGYIYDSAIAADSQFNDPAWVRGVYGAREFSTDDKIVKLDEKVSALIREMCA